MAYARRWMMAQAESQLAWLAQHPEEERRFAGEWILVEDGRIIAHDADLATALRIARSHPDALLAQAHGDEGLVL